MATLLGAKVKTADLCDDCRTADKHREICRACTTKALESYGWIRSDASLDGRTRDLSKKDSTK